MPSTLRSSSSVSMCRGDATSDPPGARGFSRRGSGTPPNRRSWRRVEPVAVVGLPHAAGLELRGQRVAQNPDLNRCFSPGRSNRSTRGCTSSLTHGQARTRIGFVGNQVGFDPHGAEPGARWRPRPSEEPSRPVQNDSTCSRATSYSCRASRRAYARSQHGHDVGLGQPGIEVRWFRGR